MITEYNKEVLKKGLEYFGVDLNNEIIERFDIYLSSLLEWNEKVNLTAIIDEKEIIVKHFLDSVSCMQSGLKFTGLKAIDVGTGAGFPGIPLKIVNPGLDLTLLDSLNKRVNFLTDLTDRLGIKCMIVHGRAEDFGAKAGFRESYDVALSRAVAATNILVEYTLPFVKIGGYLVCQKGPSVTDEIKQAERAIEILGGGKADIISTKVYSSDLDHRILLVKKEKACPQKYPRKAGTVEKKPII